jgi:DinB superfamily
MATTTVPTSPDPIADAAAYQQSLLTALGDDDPAEAQATTSATLRALVTEAGERVASRPAPGEWSVLGCIAHIVDAEIVMSARYRWILAHEEPELIGYDQDLWVDALHDDEDPAEMLDLFDALRAANVALWRRSTPDQRARVGIHRERGRESYELCFRMLGGHDRVHIAQARRALEAARRS